MWKTNLDHIMVCCNFWRHFKLVYKMAVTFSQICFRRPSFPGDCLTCGVKEWEKIIFSLKLPILSPWLSQTQPGRTHVISRIRALKIIFCHFEKSFFYIYPNSLTHKETSAMFIISFFGILITPLGGHHPRISLNLCHHRLFLAGELLRKMHLFCLSKFFLTTLITRLD